MATNASNVSVGKPAVAGAVHRAPTGTSLPTTAAATLAAAFKDMGYISDEGWTNTKSRETTEVKAWGGDTVLQPQTSKTDTFKMTFIEALNEDVLKAVQGDTNVSGSLATGLTVKENSKELEEASWVIDTVLAGGALKRTVIPKGQITEIGDVVHKDDEPIGYEVTITAFPNNSGDTHYEYYYKAESGGSSATSGATSGATS